MSRQRLLVALGGNALLRRHEQPGAALQRANVERAVAALAPLRSGYDLVITHGNGPQVGYLAELAEVGATAAVPAYPLDLIGAESVGLIGGLLARALLDSAPELPAAVLLTQVAVAADDPAFAAPGKPIGPLYDEPTARRLADERGWQIAPDGDRWRRVVASPEPCRVIELAAIKVLVAAGVTVVCAGGGGLPVVQQGDSRYESIAAVIDKDLVSALLAFELAAEGLLLLTDVAGLHIGWPAPDARLLRQASPAWLRTQRFAAGSMGPKVEAACRHVERGGGWAAIGALEQAAAVLAGTAGTRILATDTAPRYWGD